MCQPKCISFIFFLIYLKTYSPSRCMYCFHPRSHANYIFCYKLFFLKQARTTISTVSRQKKGFCASFNSYTMGCNSVFYGLWFLPVANRVTNVNECLIITIFLPVFYLQESITWLSVGALFLSIWGNLLVRETWFEVYIRLHISVYGRLVGSMFSITLAFLFTQDTQPLSILGIGFIIWNLLYATELYWSFWQLCRTED